MATKTYSGVERFQATLAASGKPYKGSTETNPSPSIINEYPYNTGIERFQQIQQKIAASRQPTKVKDNTGNASAVKVATSNLSGIDSFLKVHETSKLPAQDQQSPVRNEQPTSAVDNQYPYNPPRQQAQEPIVTSSDGSRSSNPVQTDHDTSQPNQDNQSGIAKFQGIVSGSQTAPNKTSSNQYDNSGNLNLPGRNGEKPVDYVAMLETLQKYNDKEFGKASAYAGLTRLGNALGGHAEYQPWWS